MALCRGRTSTEGTLASLAQDIAEGRCFSRAVCDGGHQLPVHHTARKEGTWQLKLRAERVQAAGRLHAGGLRAGGAACRRCMAAGQARTCERLCSKGPLHQVVLQAMADGILFSTFC